MCSVHAVCFTERFWRASVCARAARVLTLSIVRLMPTGGLLVAAMFNGISMCANVAAMPCLEIPGKISIFRYGHLARCCACSLEAKGKAERYDTWIDLDGLLVA